MSGAAHQSSWLASSLRQASEKSQRLPEAIKSGSFSASGGQREEKPTKGETKK